MDEQHRTDPVAVLISPSGPARPAAPLARWTTVPTHLVQARDRATALPRSMRHGGHADAQPATGRVVVVHGCSDGGGIIFAAARADVELTASAVRHSSGFLCVALPG
ncbi:hypothetical protein ABT324_28740 [Saccharopolyspora sp. NPDC000359]|uniref:hypothetical protein n=1 Tax=Saccharopolyspora sp. NPDC000359 TaxID=3154251 RepID=UPI0033259431